MNFLIGVKYRTCYDVEEPRYQYDGKKLSFLPVESIDKDV